MRAFPIACLVFVACSGARPIPPVDRSDSCASVVHRIERSSELTEAQKQAVLDELKGHTVEWSVRVLAVSQFADNLDGPRSFSIDAECDNVPRLAGTSLRYLMTLYVSDPNAVGIETLRRGAVVPVRATLRRYEGRNAFSAKGYLSARDNQAAPRPASADSSGPEAPASSDEAAAPEPKPAGLAPLASPSPSADPKAKPPPPSKPKAAPRAKPRGR